MSPSSTRGAIRTGVAMAVAALALAGVPAAASAQEPAASIVLGDPNDERGLVQIDEGDGRTTPVTVEGRSGRATAPGDNPIWARHMYFRVDDTVAHDGAYAACVRVEYFDQGNGAFALQYDSTAGAYSSAGDVQRTGTGTWKTAAFDLLGDARFANRQNGGSDFRLAAGSGDANTLTVHAVTLTISEPGRTTAPCSSASAPPRHKWKLLYAEGFDNPLELDETSWIRDNYDDPFDTIMDDAGRWYENDYGPAWNDALNSFTTYRKEVEIGKDGWLTASLSARDWNKDGVLEAPPSIETEKLTGQGNVAKLDVPDHTGGAIFRPTRKLPSEYRIEYKLKTLDFGGKRDGTIYYDGKENGYSEGCKTQHPWGEGPFSPGWSGDASAPYCEWQSVRDGPYGYNGFHFLTIVDFANPAPRNNHFWHYRRKVLMDSFSQHPDRVGTGTGGRVCNSDTGTYYDYRDGNFNTVNMWVNGLPNFSPGQGGLTGNQQLFMTSCSFGVAQPVLSSAAELQPELMPDEDYTFAIERDKTGYTLEASGNFTRVGHKTLRFHRDFVDASGRPIWHYNNTPDQYDGRFDSSLVQNGVVNDYEWPHQWPAGSGYPDYFVIGDLYTNVYEGNARLDDIKLYTLKEGK